MAGLSEKVVWPIVAIIIFAVLIGFYIDDRRGLANGGGEADKQQASSKEHGGKAANEKQASNEHAGKTAENKDASNSSGKSSNNQAAKATSMDMNEYLSESAGERSKELEANAAHHQGFSGSIDDYLSGGKAKTTNNMQAGSNAKQQSHSQASGATSMSMDEYQAQADGKTNGKSNSGSTGAYHGGIDEYLAKYGDGAQTPVKKQSSDPFVDKENMGFHGSYEEYAKKYN